MPFTACSKLRVRSLSSLQLQMKTRGEMTVVEIPSERVGLVIGPKGSTIKRLMSDSGARIDLDDGDTPQGTRLVRLTGTPISRQRCAEEIQKIVWKAVIVSVE